MTRRSVVVRPRSNITLTSCRVDPQFDFTTRPATVVRASTLSTAAIVDKSRTNSSKDSRHVLGTSAPPFDSPRHPRVAPSHARHLADRCILPSFHLQPARRAAASQSCCSRR